MGGGSSPVGFQLVEMVVAESLSETDVRSQEVKPSAQEELARNPQRGSRWLDLLILALIVFVLLGGIGKAFSDSDLFAESKGTAVPGVENCPAGGCVKPPEELCAGRPYKAIVMEDGRRLYFAGDHPQYQGFLAIHTERGDRWFCTQGGAEAAGFLAAPLP
jgi:hypothetical protein